MGILLEKDHPMHNRPLNRIDEITPTWLTDILREGGYLTRGTVLEMQTRAQTSNWASNATLRLRYSADALGEKPTKLFIKLCNPGLGTFGDSEIVYYTLVAPELDDPPLPHCYHSAYDKEQGNYHLVLQDVSETHAPDITPTWELAVSTITALAQLHAGWWNHPKLSSVGEFPTRKKIEKYVAHADKGLTLMLEEVGAKLPKEWLNLIDKIFKTHREKMIERARDTKTWTFIHGDLNPGNILSPIGTVDKIYLIDHQPFDSSLTIWLGVSDLSYMMVHWWETDMRRAWEQPLLENYHQHLLRLGVRDYSFNQLWTDYRLCAMQSLYVPASWCVHPAQGKEMKWLWEAQLKKTMTACVDLKCSELLE